MNNLTQTESDKLDYASKDISEKIKNKIKLMGSYKKTLDNAVSTLENEIISVFSTWLIVLKELAPNRTKMDPIKLANHLILEGKLDQAIEILDSVAASPDGMNKEAFNLLQNCYIRGGNSDKYRELHNRFGNILGLTYPDLNKLNNYLKAVTNSIFMIQGVSHTHGMYSGTGFSFTRSLIVTNRHVVEGSSASDIRVIGKSQSYNVDNMILDPVNDIAVLQISSALEPLRLGEFDFVEPGEQVIAIGFPSPESNQYNDNIYISKGMINSVRKTGDLPGRVLYIDAKIGQGMSGGPVINDLGEVVGIITFIKYKIESNEQGIFASENQPVAIPIHLVKRLI